MLVLRIDENFSIDIAQTYMNNTRSNEMSAGRYRICVVFQEKKFVKEFRNNFAFLSSSNIREAFTWDTSGGEIEGMTLADNDFFTILYGKTVQISYNKKHGY